MKQDGFIKVGKYGLQESTYSLPASSQTKSKVHASCFMIDSPNALCSLALMLSKFVQIKALNISWLCFQTEKLRQSSAKLIPEVIGKTMDFLPWCCYFS